MIEGGQHVNNREELLSFLDSISELLSVVPNKLARVEGQFLTRNGSQVYPVRFGGKTVYVTIPED